MPEWTEAENNFAKSLQKEMGAKEVGYEVKLILCANLRILRQEAPQQMSEKYR